MKRDMCAPQPDPKPGRASVTDGMIEDLKERRTGGIKKYGGELESGNGREALVDAYQEAMDMALYLRQRVMEDVDLHEARAELEKVKVTLYRLRDVLPTPGWVFEDLMTQLDFAIERIAPEAEKRSSAE